MAPYIGLMQQLTPEEKQIVVMFLTESEQPKTAVVEQEQTTTPKSNAEIIRKKYKSLKISPEIERLRGCLKLTKEELEDERTQYILGL